MKLLIWIFLIGLIIIFIPLKTFSEEILYFADGYHGGYYLTSLVPLRESFQALFYLLETYPQYKVNLEIEPYTLEKLKYGPHFEWEQSQIIVADSSIINGIKKYIEMGKIELVGGTYTQPLLFAISGESCIRQIKIGSDVIKDIFGVNLETYATQEPCFTSQLPQILNGFDFKYAVLKNTWALFGNPPAIKKSRVWWIGPDGSKIDTSPRYEFNQYYNYVLDIYPSYNFMRQAYKEGIENPVTFNLGDFIKFAPGTRTSWVPWFNEAELLQTSPNYLKFTTWEEYFNNTPSPQDTDVWKLTYNDFAYRFPWGLLGGKVQKRVREAENKLIEAEKIASIAYTVANIPYPAEDLEKGWKLLLMAQHHDAWVCAPISFGAWTSDKSYADWVDFWTGEAMNLAEEVIKNSLRGMSSLISCPQGELAVIVCNTLPQDYYGFVELKDVLCPEKNFSGQIEIVDINGQIIPAFVEILEKYPDNSIKKVNLSFIHKIPSFGYTTFFLKNKVTKDDNIPRKLVSSNINNQIITLENEFYRIQITGEGVKSIFDKELNKELLYNPINLRGFFYTSSLLGKSCRSDIKEVDLIKSTPFSSVVRIKGNISSIPFSMEVTLPSTKRIDFDITLDFGEKLLVGSSTLNAIEDWIDNTKKLSIHFPIDLNLSDVIADAPYDVYKPNNSEFQALNWIEVFDEKSNIGLSLIGDRATSYMVKKNSNITDISVILGYGGAFEYALSKSAPLKGKETYRISLSSHNETHWRENDNLRLMTELDYPPKSLSIIPQETNRHVSVAEERSILELIEGEISVEAIYIEDNSLFIRLFNPSIREETTKIRVDNLLSDKKISEVKLNNKPVKVLNVDQSIISLEISPKEIKTIRIDLK